MQRNHLFLMYFWASSGATHWRPKDKFIHGAEKGGRADRCVRAGGMGEACDLVQTLRLYVIPEEWEPPGHPLDCHSQRTGCHGSWADPPPTAQKEHVLGVCLQGL